MIHDDALSRVEGPVGVGATMERRLDVAIERWCDRVRLGSRSSCPAKVQLCFGAWQHSVNSQLLLRIKELKNSETWADGRQTHSLYNMELRLVLI